MANPTVEPTLADLILGRGRRRITLDQEALKHGRLVPVVAETGEVVANAKHITFDEPIDGYCTLTVTFILTDLYEKPEP